MSNTSLNSFIQSIKSKNPTTSASMDEASIIQVVNSLFDLDISVLDAIKELPLHSVFLYDIPDGKKTFTVEVARKCISDTNLKPYSGKHIFILRHFDMANNEAMNALLKLLEDTPSYAVIILEVDNTTSLLETIRSRTLRFETKKNINTLDEETEELLAQFDPSKPSKWILHLHSASYTRQEAIEILQRVYHKYDFEKQQLCQDMIRSLYTTNEPVRNILDTFFLCDT